MSEHYKFMCGCECWISNKSNICTCSHGIFLYVETEIPRKKNLRKEDLVKWQVALLKPLRMMWFSTFVIYKKQQQKCSLPFLSDQHALPQWRSALWWCLKYTIIDIPGHEYNIDNTNIHPMIIFHVYRLVSHFTVHGGRPY